MAMVGLDLVVIAGYVCLMEEERDGREEREVNYLYYLIE